MKTLESLVRRFVEGHPQDAGKAVEELDVAEAAKIIAKLPLRLSSLLLERLDPQKAATILETFGPIRTKEMLETVSPKKAAFVLQYLDMGKREEVLGALPDSSARQLRELMQYPENSLNKIKTSGQLTIITDNNANCYYIYRDKPMEFEYDLSKAFADYL